MSSPDRLDFVETTSVRSIANSNSHARSDSRMVLPNIRRAAQKCWKILRSHHNWCLLALNYFIGYLLYDFFCIFLKISDAWFTMSVLFDEHIDCLRSDIILFRIDSCISQRLS